MGGVFGSVTRKKMSTDYQAVANSFTELTKEDVQLATLAVHKEAVKSIQNNSDGETQKRYKPYRYVKVSAPGSPPNTDTGRLAQSIIFEFENGPDGFSGYVGTNLKYGRSLELGTSKMRARPWLRPALIQGTQNFIKSLVNKLKNNLKR